MGQQFRLRRLIGVIPVVAGQPGSIDLPRGYDYEALLLELTGSVQVTTNFTDGRAEAPSQVIARAEIVADGRNTLYSAPGWYGVFGKHDRLGKGGSSQTVTPPANITVGTYAIECASVIDFQSPDTVRSKDSNFRTSGLQLFQLRLTFGNAADLFVGAGVAAFVNCQVEVSSVEMVELADAQGNRTTPNLLKKVSYQEQAVPATNAAQEIRLPAGNLIKSLCIRASIAGEPDATVLSTVEASSGTDVRVKMAAKSLNRQNTYDYGPLAATNGYYIADFVRSGDSIGNLSELWDVTRQAEPKLILGVTGGATNKVQVVITEFLPVPA